MHKTATLALGVVLLMLATSINAQTTLVVNSDRDLGDVAPGDGQCDTGATIGLAPECTLRAAIHEANQTTGAVTIEFWDQIETTGGWTTITVGFGGLPPLENEITIAGNTHPDYTAANGAPRVFLQSESTTDTVDGLTLLGDLASGSTIRALSIGYFTGNGIEIDGGSNHVVEDTTIGAFWTPTDLNLAGNGESGIRITGGATGSVISGNHIVDNDSHGILIATCLQPICSDGVADIQISGNGIGLAPPVNDENRPAGNGGTGILVGAGHDPNIIGGLAPINWITANQANGIELYSDGQLIQRNRVGVPPLAGPASGYESSDYGNGEVGILVRSAGNSIGGRIAVPPAGSIGVPNWVGNATSTAIRIDDEDTAGFDSSDNIIDFNYIGTNPDGSNFGNDSAAGVVIMTGHGNIVRNALIRHHSTGVALSSRTATGDPLNKVVGNEIIDNSFTGVRFHAVGRLGGTNPSDANIIGNNLRGVHVTDTGDTRPVQILGNYIGTDIDGNDLGNDVGILVSDDNLVDIGWAGAGNVIGHNEDGIALTQSASDTWIVGNHIGLHPTAGPIGNQIGIKYFVGSVSGVNASKVGYGAGETIDPDNWEPGNGSGNIIAHNAVAGVDLSGADGNSINNAIRGNQFIDNNGNAIDLGMDALDESFGSATGPNTQINFPEFNTNLTLYDPSTDTINYSYRVRMDTAEINYPLRVDFYLTGENPGEGRTYLGTDSYQSAEAMGWKNGTLTPPNGVQVWHYLTATATDTDGNTSQFSLEPVLLRELTDKVFHDRFEQ